MADILATYRLTWIDGGSGTFGLYTSDTFPPGTNVYVSAALSHVGAHDEAVAANNGVRAFAFIYEWSVYGENGEIQTVPSPADPFLNAVFINNCATVTMGLFAGGGQGEGQYTIFST
jgi:hypothetical protein